jgi:hemerythrin
MNMALEWEYEKMTTGLADIDDEHKEWIRRFNEFDSAVTSDGGQDALQSALRFFLQYTESHFAHEEAIMTRYQCPAAAANQAAHKGFRAQLAEIEGWVMQEGASLFEVVSLKLLLEEWMTNHICTIDVQLRDSARGSHTALL